MTPAYQWRVISNNKTRFIEKKYQICMSLKQVRESKVHKNAYT